MKISDTRRKIIAKLFLNFASVIFGLLVIGPFVSGQQFAAIVFIVGCVLLFFVSVLAIVSEPPEIEEE